MIFNIGLVSRMNLVFEGDAAAVHDLFAFCAFRRELLLEAADAVDVGVVRNDERTTPDLKKSRV